MHIKKLFTNEERILSKSLPLLGFLSIFGSFMFLWMTKNQSIKLPASITTGIIVFGFLVALFCFLSSKVKCLQYFTIFLVSFYIALVGSFQQMNISLLFILPIYLAYCLQSRKKLMVILFTDIFFFNISKIFKSYNIYIINPRIYNFKIVLVSNLITSIFESVIFLAIAVPVFLLLTNQNAELKKSLKEKDDATNDILQFCSTATSFHNKYLTVHIRGVRDITRIILDSLRDGGVYIGDNLYEQIIFSVQFHDIGKIYIDSSILDKNGSLSEDEFNLIKEHPARGIELFNLLPKNVLNEDYMATCKNVILQHHERLDGTGYPSGTKQISFEAKIVAVADVVDALLSWRPYKPPYTWEKMVQILEENKTGYNYECIKQVYNCKQKIMAISDSNNRALKELLFLSEEDIIRR